MIVTWRAGNHGMPERILTEERHGYAMTGLDVSRRALEWLDQPGRTLIEGDLTQAIAPCAEQYDAVLAMDVIEHLDDDRAAVACLGELTRPGGVAVVSVPARPELFSEFDAVQGHRRRYLPETLRQAFEGSGLVVEQVFWWGSWVAPLLRRQQRAPGRGKEEPPEEVYRRYLALPPWPGPLILRLAFAWEEKRALHWTTRSGTSLFALARRPA